MTNNYKNYEPKYTSTIKGCPMGRWCNTPIIGHNYQTKIGIQDKTALRTIVQLTCGILAKFEMNTLRYSSAPSKVRWPSEHYCLQVGGHTPAVCQIRHAGCVDTVVFKWVVVLQSVLSLGLLSVASMSPSSLLSSSSSNDDSFPVSSRAGVGARVVLSRPVQGLR